MRYFGISLFGCLAALFALLTLWLSYGAGTEDPYATVFGVISCPIPYLIFAGPFAVLFVLSLTRGTRN